MQKQHVNNKKAKKILPTSATFTLPCINTSESCSFFRLTSDTSLSYEAMASMCPLGWSSHPQELQDFDPNKALELRFSLAIPTDSKLRKDTTSNIHFIRRGWCGIGREPNNVSQPSAPEANRLSAPNQAKLMKGASKTWQPCKPSMTTKLPAMLQACKQYCCIFLDTWHKMPRFRGCNCDRIFLQISGCTSKKLRPLSRNASLAFSWDTLEIVIECHEGTHGIHLKSCI